MKKYNLSNLVIEVTRRCNMACDHCARGEPQDMDMDMKIADSLFKHVNYIDCITFSGGEPSLVPDILTQIIKTARENKVEVGYFYIATNAKVVTDDFIRSLLEWHIFCGDEDDLNSVEISDDAFHEDVDPDNIRKLKAFRFVSMRESKSNSYDDGDRLIRQGRAALNFACKDEERPLAIELTEDSVSEDLLYLNCKGDLLSNCDLSYETQDKNDFKIGNVMDKNFDLGKAVEEYNKRPFYEE